MMTPLPGRDYCLKPEPGSIPLGQSTARNGRAPLTRFVSLRRNPDEPIAAIGIVRALLAQKTPPRSRRSVEVSVGPTHWGEVRRHLKIAGRIAFFTICSGYQLPLAEVATQPVQHSR